MLDVTELRKGVTFELDGRVYRVLEYHHHKPGRGKAIIRVKARDLQSGAIVERTFPSGNQVKEVNLDHHEAQYLYNDGRDYYFMDMETYEQYAIPADVLGDAVYYLKEGMPVKVTFLKGQPLDIELPITVDMEVVEAEVAVKGDTATGLTKKVVTETGLKIEVPHFIQAGDIIRVDTRTGEYVTRVKQ
ncbi:MAG: elongation factor P [Chloroflexi bacterium]|nr:elongation factor P [Chloroflexota bacterium]